MSSQERQGRFSPLHWSDIGKPSRTGETDSGTGLDASLSFKTRVKQAVAVAAAQCKQKLSNDQTSGYDCFEMIDGRPKEYQKYLDIKFLQDHHQHAQQDPEETYRIDLPGSENKRFPVGSPRSHSFQATSDGLIMKWDYLEPKTRAMSIPLGRKTIYRHPKLSNLSDFSKASLRSTNPVVVTGRSSNPHHLSSANLGASPSQSQSKESNPHSQTNHRIETAEKPNPTIQNDNKKTPPPPVPVSASTPTPHKTDLRRNANRKASKKPTAPASAHKTETKTKTGVAVAVTIQSYHHRREANPTPKRAVDKERRQDGARKGSSIGGGGEAVSRISSLALARRADTDTDTDKHENEDDREEKEGEKGAGKGLSFGQTHSLQRRGIRLASFESLRAGQRLLVTPYAAVAVADTHTHTHTHALHTHPRIHAYTT